MPFNFLEKEANDRLIAAIIGSIDNKVNTHTHMSYHSQPLTHIHRSTLKEVARIYGPSVPFNTIEWYVRKICHQAVAMRAEADGNPVPAASPAKGRAKKAGNTSPVKAGVKNGRITKKKTSPVKIKPEALDEHILGFGMEDQGDTGDNNDVFSVGDNDVDEVSGDEV